VGYNILSALTKRTPNYVIGKWEETETKKRINEDLECCVHECRMATQSYNHKRPGFHSSNSHTGPI
jgi:hypothetical protein